MLQVIHLEEHLELIKYSHKGYFRPNICQGRFKRKVRLQIAKAVLRKKNGAGESTALTSDYTIKLR